MRSSQVLSRAEPAMWDGYQSAGCWDEMLCDGLPRLACEGVVRYLAALGHQLVGRQEAAELAVRSMGITFTVYSEASNIDKAWPFDVIPRVISTQEWGRRRQARARRVRCVLRCRCL